MTRTKEIERRNAKQAKRALRDLAFPKPKDDGPGYQSATERRQAIRWQFPTEGE